MTNESKPKSGAVPGTAVTTVGSSLEIQTGGVSIQLSAGSVQVSQAMGGVVVVTSTPAPFAALARSPGPDVDWSPGGTLPSPLAVPLLVILGTLALGLSVATFNPIPALLGALFAAALVGRRARIARRRARLAAPRPDAAIARAAQKRGVFSSADIVADTGLPFDTVDHELGRLAAAGHVALDNDPDTGLVVYRLPVTQGSRTVVGGA